MRSLTRRAFLLLTFFFVFICTGSLLLLRLFLPDGGIISRRSTLHTETEALVSTLRQSDRSSGMAAIRQFELDHGTELFLLSADHTVLNPFTMQPQESAAPPTGEEYPFRFADSMDEYYLTISTHSVRAEQMQRAFWQCIPVIWVISLLLALLCARLFSYWAVRPIRRVSNIAKHMAELDFSWYCPDVRGDEIGVLSENLNLLSDKLQAALTELNDRNQLLQDEIALEKERERRRMLFLSGVTHELKTPVAVVIGQLEGMQANIGIYRDRDKYLARCAEIMQSLNDFIREILLVSHLDMTDAKPPPEMDLSAALSELCEDYRAFAAEKDIAFHAELASGLTVFAEPMLLKKALGNILGNAAAHTAAHGTISAILRQTDEGAVLTVENTPAHIGAEHLPHLFEAFYRADPAAKHSSGLGLYITATILALYHMPYRIENTENGVLFTVHFP